MGKRRTILALFCMVLIIALTYLTYIVPANAAGPQAVHRYQTGKAVRGLQWMGQGHSPSIYKIVWWHHSVNGIYDKRFATSVENMKFRLGYPAQSLNGNIAGPTFIGFLKGNRRPYSYRKRTGDRLVALARAQGKLQGTVLEGRIRTLVADANYLIAHRAWVNYSQVHRMDIVKQQLTMPRLIYRFNRGWYISEDCSSSVTGLYWLAAGGSQTTPHPTGLPDPNGYTNPPFPGYGYTGTQSSSGRVVWHIGQSLGLLRPGDVIFYGGGWPHHHEAMYLGNGRVFSHGTNTGPYNLPVLYRADAVGAHRYVTVG